MCSVTRCCFPYSLWFWLQFLPRVITKNILLLQIVFSATTAVASSTEIALSFVRSFSNTHSPIQKLEMAKRRKRNQLRVAQQRVAVAQLGKVCLLLFSVVVVVGSSVIVIVCYCCHRPSHIWLLLATTSVQFVVFGQGVESSFHNCMNFCFCCHFASFVGFSRCHSESWLLFLHVLLLSVVSFVFLSVWFDVVILLLSISIR